MWVQMTEEVRGAVEEMADGARDVLQELLVTVEDAASSAGFVSALVDNLNKAIVQVSV